MDRFTGPQRAFCVKQFYLNNGSLIIVRRLFRVEYDLHDLNQCPSTVLIKKWVKKFEETGSTLNVKQAGAARTCRSEENVLRVSASVRSTEYVKMLRLFLSPQLQEFAGYNRRTWFQQDGATCHTSNESLPVVKEMFPEKLISRRGDILWPPRSPDLSPADFFLWGYLKHRVYIHKPRTLLELKAKIREEMSAISRSLCRRVLGNFRSRLEECRSQDGRHLTDIIFKK